MTRPLRYLSVCSGIEAASVAWAPLGWQPFGFSEIDKFPSAVLAQHYPDVPNFGDMTKFREWPDGSVDLLVGGTPCQSFSVAGLRKGLADPRGNLALTFLAIADRYRPRWVVWENVPGVLSSNGGRDFGAFLGGLAELGYGFAYRVLDAQYVRVDGYPRAVPQRRRRVFVVGYLGDWAAPAAVLFERESLSGSAPPRREQGQVAPTISSRRTGGGGLGTDFDLDGGLIPAHIVGGFQSGEIAGTVSSKWAKGTGGPSGDECQNLVAVGFNGREDPVHGPVAGALGTSSPQAQCVAFKASHYTRGKDGAPSVVSPPLSVDADRGDQDTLVAHPVFAFDMRGREGGAMPEGPHDTANIRASEGGSSRSYVAQNDPPDWLVRRLTPRECERLQGFADNWTLVPYRNGKPAADSPRYKAIGNSMAIPPMRWIGQRIQMVEGML